ILRRLQESGRAPDPVGEDEGVTEESRVRGRGDQERADRVVRPAGREERAQLVLHDVELARLRGGAEGGGGRLDPWDFKGRDLSDAGAFHRLREDEPEVREGEEPPGEA